MKMPGELVQNLSSDKIIQVRLNKNFLGVRVGKMQIKPNFL